MSVVIETTLGDVTVDLFVEQRPQTCLNFLKLCKIKYYNLNLFHNVTADFLAQTGDPTGKGDGGESIFGIIKGNQHRLYQGEKLPRIKHNMAGLISMVSHGNGMLGSQFIITLNSDLSSLDQEHCVFGYIAEGKDLLLKLNEAITDDQHRPYQDIRITHTVVLDDPFPDPEGLEIPTASPLPQSQKDAAYSRIPADEPLTDNYSQEELDEMVQQREAAARAAILEMVGDLPDAEAAPPENVLFVCKLNPVTSDHDLSIIFSRFGTVKSCEVIRDQVSGDSLQYAFVEFEDRKACEDAYFKMDNVLIDDRRIHVDFSQSVAKLKWKGKGRGVEMLGPPPPGGWGNGVQNRKSKYQNDKNINNQIRKQSRNDDRRYCEQNPVRNGRGIKNDVQVNNRKIKINEKKENRRKEKIKRRKSSSSSSSSESSSESSSTSESSESSYDKRKKSRSSRKVLVVVKTPRRGKTHKKPRKVRKKYASESDSDSRSDIPKKKKKKVRRSSTSTDDSSSEEEKKKKKRKRSPSTEDEIKTKRKKKKTQESDSSLSSNDEKKKSKTRKRKSSSDTSSDSEIRTKKRKKDKLKSKKKKQVKKPKKRRRKNSQSSSSSD